MDDLGKLLGGLSGQATGAAAAGSTDPMAALGGLTQAIQQEGGLDGLIGKLRAGGLGSQVDSWISNADNLPVAEAQVSSALGPETLQRLSSGSGIDLGSLLPMLAQFLPQIINMLTPGGKSPTGGMPDLGGLLGGVLGGGGSAQSGGLGDVLGGLGGMLGGNKG
ncbi:MAG: YidB family protein [Chloroflexota bacterium]